MRSMNLNSRLSYLPQRASASAPALPSARTVPVIVPAWRESAQKITTKTGRDLPIQTLPRAPNLIAELTLSPHISEFSAEYLARLSLTPRFSGVENLRAICETVETVLLHERAHTPLK